MKAKITFKQVNPDFSQEYADTYQEGKESENNRKYNENTSYQIDDVKKTHVNENGIITLMGRFVDTEKEYNIEIPDMYIVEFTDKDTIVYQFAVSSSILKDFTNTRRGLKYGYFYFELNPDVKFKRLPQYETIYFSVEHMSIILAQLQ